MVTANQKQNVKRLRYPTSYFVHYDLIDTNQNFSNNKTSDLLAKLNIKGKAYEKVSYHVSPQTLFMAVRQVLMKTVSLSTSEIKMVGCLILTACL